MSNVFYLINEVALFFSVFVYSATQLRHENFSKRITVAWTGYTLMILALNFVMTTGAIKADIYLRMGRYMVVVLILKYCWEVRWSYAFYYGIWSFTTWQLLHGLWQCFSNFHHLTPNS